MADSKQEKGPTGRPSSVDQLPLESGLTRLRVVAPGLPKGLRRIADFILEDPARVMGMSITDLAAATSSSDGSVINLAKQLGMKGYQQLKLSLAAESVQPVQYIHEDLDLSDDTTVATTKIFHSGIEALRGTLNVLDPKAMAKAVDIFRKAKRIEIYGIGSAAPIAEDAQYRMMRIGLDAKVETDSHKQAISASLTNPDVATLTISHSGATVETLEATRHAKEAGARTVVITNFGRSPIQAHADVVLFTMARETTFRTEAMTSRLAQLCIVDALIANLALADHKRATDTLQRTFNTLSSKRS